MYEEGGLRRALKISTTGLQCLRFDGVVEAFVWSSAIAEPKQSYSQIIYQKSNRTYQ
jgi:hypothetical protein